MASTSPLGGFTPGSNPGAPTAKTNFCGYRIAAIIFGFQPNDAGSTPATRSPKQKSPSGLFCYTFESIVFYSLTASLSALPALNFGTLVAAMLILAPVRGLTPWRAALFETL